VVKILDQMIISIVESLKNSLPKAEQETINGTQKAGSEDSLENDLVNLYKHFLTKPAIEVDQLILKFCSEIIYPTSIKQTAHPSVVHSPVPPPGYY